MSEEPSKIAERLKRLKSAIFEVAAKRERLPQPMFWSLFRDQIKSVKRRKELRRMLLEALNPEP